MMRKMQTLTYNNRNSINIYAATVSITTIRERGITRKERKKV